MHTHEYKNGETWFESKNMAKNNNGLYYWRAILTIVADSNLWEERSIIKTATKTIFINYWEGRIVAIALDCKSSLFGVQKFESSSSHKLIADVTESVRKTDPL